MNALIAATGAPVQRRIITVPPAGPGVTAISLKEYLTTTEVPATSSGISVHQEILRVVEELKVLDPALGERLMAAARAMQTRAKDDAPQAAAMLRTLVADVNAAIDTYVIDGSSISARYADRPPTATSDEGTKHHKDYFFTTPGSDAETSFDLDAWSRRPDNDFVGQADAVVKQEVDAVVAAWDPAGADNLGALLRRRLLGPGDVLSKTTASYSVSPMFARSPKNTNYTKIILAAEHALSVRIEDLPKRNINYIAWGKADKEKKEKQEHTVNVNWGELFRLIRPAIKEQMTNGTVATEDAVRPLAMDVLQNHAAIRQAVEWGLFSLDVGEGRLSVVRRRNINQKVREQPTGRLLYTDAKDDLNFDLSHVKAILFFEWKLVSDLTH